MASDLISINVESELIKMFPNKGSAWKLCEEICTWFIDELNGKEFADNQKDLMLIAVDTFTIDDFLENISNKKNDVFKYPKFVWFKEEIEAFENYFASKISDAKKNGRWNYMYDTYILVSHLT